LAFYFGFLQDFYCDFLAGWHVDAGFDFAKGALTEGFAY
jgi:hypothetical protein